MKLKQKALDYIAVEMWKKQLLFDTRHDPARFSIGTRLCIYCGTCCNGGKIRHARAILDSGDSARIASAYSLDADEAKRVLLDEEHFWHWKGDTLIVDLYSLEYERKALKHRESQTQKANKRWAKERQGKKSEKPKQPVFSQLPPPDYLNDINETK